MQLPDQCASIHSIEESSALVFFYKKFFIIKLFLNLSLYMRQRKIVFVCKDE